jgi:hypothetical protein
MPKFVAVVGQRNSGKSTIIRSLTGCSTRGYRGFIEDNLTGRSIYVVCSSPQEDPLSPEGLRGILSEVSARENCQGLIMATQPNRPYERLSMEEILNEASTRQFQVHVFVIDPDQSGAQGASTIVASRLSNLGITPTVLDGRRFSLVNAQEINHTTHVVS